MKYFRVGVPFLVVALSVVNGLTALGSDNMPALWANITALFGWMAIAFDEYVTYHRNNRSV